MGIERLLEKRNATNMSFDREITGIHLVKKVVATADCNWNCNCDCKCVTTNCACECACTKG